jgi:hypothetical protein
MHGTGGAKPAPTAVPGNAGDDQTFERFVAETGPRLGRALAALIFSRATLWLIGERTVIARTGQVTGATAIIDRAFVNHYGQIP